MGVDTQILHAVVLPLQHHLKRGFHDPQVHEMGLDLEVLLMDRLYASLYLTMRRCQNEPPRVLDTYLQEIKVTRCIHEEMGT